ncbi:hypothetical protein [Enterocloster citroniae]|uniref:hypothetical protein n=1 Tax=Enterocloster citroniae TaxID=358743 RepID=UPI0034A4C929
MMFVVCCFYKEKCRVLLKGDSLKLLTLLVSASKSVAEIIAKEKNIDIDSAIYFVTESIEQGYKTLN